MDWDKTEERLQTLLQAGRHSELRGALMMLNEVDIAKFMEGLDKEKLLLVFRRQRHAHPFCVGRAAFPNIHRNIEHLAGDDANQLRLRKPPLHMEPAQHAHPGFGLVVLHEPAGDPGFEEVLLVVGLHEVSAGVAEHLWFEDEKAFYFCCYYVHCLRLETQRH